MSEGPPKGDIPEEVNGAESMDVFMFINETKMRRRGFPFLCLSVLV